MNTISTVKNQEITDTPVLLFTCVLTDGTEERWSTHKVVNDGKSYAPRVLKHNLFELRSLSEDGVDGVAKLSITLNNIDSYCSQLERTHRVKGAQLTVHFAFIDATTGELTTESQIVFRGMANAPEEITDDSARFSFVNRLSLQRQYLPAIRIQRRCPWTFPATVQQRTESTSGGDEGKYSEFFRCGYSPDVAGGSGSMAGAQPFTSCNYSRRDCEQRGMFSVDSSNRITRRFGGFEFVPSSILVKTFGERSSHVSPVETNEAKYNDFVPMVYGTAWLRPPVVFARNDGNLTRMEVLLSVGEIESVLKVVVNGIEIPVGRAGAKMTGTGWYSVVSYGNRTGNFNLDFAGPNGQPLGDPYGSMAYLSVVVPNRISDGTSLPKVEALIKGLKLSRFDETGGYLDEAFSNNPAWVLLDLIRRCGWKIGEIDSASFARAAAFCEEPISSEDLNGTQVSIPRFQCNLVLAKRRTASDVIRGVKTGSGLMLRYGRDGSLECLPETALALQQPTKRPGSNAPAPLNGGWPVYEFGDGTSGRSGILRRSNGEPAFRVWSRSSAETPNRYSAEFQDEFNYYQQDSLSIVDTEDAVATRQELSASLTALGLPNFSQAGRVIRMSLNRGLRGNTFVEFETSLLGLGVLPGDLITITYLKSGFDRQPFRVMSMRPGLNFATCVITAQIHEDEWYLGTGETDLGLLGGGYEASISQGAPRPLQGNLLEGATSTWKIGEKRLTGADGATRVLLSAGFLVPPASISSALTPPMLSVSATTSATGGSLRGGTTFYYCVSAVDAQGHESQPSFVVRATTPEGTDTCSATLRSVSFPSAATGCLLYRGTSPDQLLKIGGTRPLGATLTDGGDSETTGVPADRNYHHAAFYWRFELLPSTPCTSAGPDFIGNSTLGLIDDEYRGRLVRIVEGKGMGQEREIARNDSQSLRVSIDWEDVPDQTSRFVISEESWKLGALARTSPAEFEVPNRDGAIVQICGRAANVRNVESAYELAPIARHALLGGGGVGDSEVPSRLSYGLSCPGNGTIEVAGLSFESLSNTRSVTTATLTLHSVDELGTTEAVTAQALGSTETTVSIGGGGLGVEPGAFVIIGREIIRVTEVSGSELTLERGQLGSSATSHEASTPVMPLVKRVEVLSFPRDFFGTLASGSYRFLTSWPNQRIVASELFATNALGNSPVRTLYFANTSTWGIRTLSGGQFTLQVDGTLAIQDGAVPPISVDTGCAVVDVFAKCQGAPELVPLELRVTVDGMPWCSLTVPPGEATSNIVSGLTLRPLRAGSLLGLDIVSLGASVDSAPGRDLTVTVRV